MSDDSTRLGNAGIFHNTVFHKKLPLSLFFRHRIDAVIASGDLSASVFSSNISFTPSLTPSNVTVK